MSINLQTVAELKKLIAEKYNVELHFHDSCGSGAYFSLEQPDEEITRFIQEYFRAKNRTVEVSPSGLNFSVF